MTLGNTGPKNGVLGDSPSARLTQGNLPRLHYNFNETFLHVLDQIFKTNKQAKKQANPACTARILPFWHFLNVSEALKISLARAKLDFFCITPLPDHSPVHCPGEWHYHGHLWQLFLVPIFQCSLLVLFPCSIPLQNQSVVSISYKISAGRQIWFVWYSTHVSPLILGGGCLSWLNR